MGRESQKNSAIELAARKIELIEGLQRALDRNYRRLLQAARADWERLFAVKKPTETRVGAPSPSPETAVRAKALPGSGFLKLRKPEQPKGAAKRSSPRFAH